MKLAIFTGVIASLAIVQTAVGQVCTTGANVGTLNGLTITNVVKRATVNGGSRVTQTITVKNTGAAAANGLALRSTPLAAELTLGKAGSKPKTTVSSAGGVVTSTAFSLAAGATLKAAITYTSQRCPPATVTRNLPIEVFVPGDATPATCAKTGPTATVRTCFGGGHLFRQ